MTNEEMERQRTELEEQIRGTKRELEATPEGTRKHAALKRRLEGLYDDMDTLFNTWAVFGSIIDSVAL